MISRNSGSTYLTSSLAHSLHTHQPTSIPAAPYSYLVLPQLRLIGASLVCLQQERLSLSHILYLFLWQINGVKMGQRKCLELGDLMEKQTKE